jgi:hypothetical protein
MSNLYQDTKIDYNSSSLSNDTSINKTEINLLTNKKELIVSYTNDNVTPMIVKIANQIISKLKTLELTDYSFLNYVVVELSYNKKEIGIKFVFQKTIPTNIKDILNSIYLNLLVEHNIVIFCYQPDHSSLERFFISKTEFFDDMYDDTPWIHQIDSFVQNSNSSTIHKIINSWIEKSTIQKCNFFGIGGEMGYYAKKNKNMFDKIFLLSPKKSSY